MATGGSAAQATDVVRAALDLGIDFIDTARAYGTESAVGAALKGVRDRVVVSSKAMVATGAGLIGAADLAASLEHSLTRLATDYIDIFHLHGVTAAQYPHCRDVLAPELQRQRAAGKIRYLGITERFSDDTAHEMLQQALPDNLFDVVMVGFNLLNPSARKTVFPHTIVRDVGTLIMFAVRRALHDDASAAAAVAGLLARGGIAATDVAVDGLTGLLRRGGVGSVVEAAYRFCRHEPGAHVVLTGTGSIDHLAHNVAAILAPPLPDDVAAGLRQMFGSVDSVSGN